MPILIEAVDQGRNQGGERVAPLGFTAQNSGGGNQNPHRSHEICAETDKKHARAVGPLWSSGSARKTGPLWLSGAPVTAEVISSYPSEYRGPLIIRDLWSSRAIWSSGPLWLSGALPTVRVPLNITGLLGSRGPPNCQGSPKYQGVSESIRGSFWPSGTLPTSRALPTVRDPPNIRDLWVWVAGLWISGAYDHRGPSNRPFHV